MNNLSQNNFLLMCFSKESELRSLSAFATHFASLTRLLSTRFQINWFGLGLWCFLLIIVWSRDHPHRMRGDLFLLSIAM